VSGAALIKSVLLALPLAFIASRMLPARLPAALRLAGGLAAGWLLAAALTLFVPVGTMSYLVSFAIVGSIYAVITLGLNVQWGYTGLFNIGIAAFFSVGAFTTALVTTRAPTGAAAAFTQQAFGLGAPFLVGVLAAGAVAGLLALLVGGPTLRLRGDFLAIATIGIAEIIRLDLPERALAGQRPAAAARHPAPAGLPVRDPGLRLAARGGRQFCRRRSPRATTRYFYLSHRGAVRGRHLPRAGARLPLALGADAAGGARRGGLGRHERQDTSPCVRVQSFVVGG
jgi:branched-chain amino acid transport system permease protein